jgi:hypothetical protein
LAVEILKRHGVDVGPLIWDSDEAGEDQSAGIVIRSCWDYHYQPNRFLEWIGSVSERNTPLWNPARVIEWNLNKVYLRDLSEKGVTIPETVWLEQGSKIELAAILDRQRWQKAVVKPAISATAFRTFVTSPKTAGQEQPAFDEMLSVSEVIVQQFVDEVLTRGEWSLLFFGGRFSHAVLKSPRAGDFRVQEDFGGQARAVVPPAGLVEEAQSILGLIEEPLLFARVDGVEIDGRLSLMELELIEPMLFLSHDREAPRRFAEAIIAFC